MLIDESLLASRGANLCGQDLLEIRACLGCNQHYLYNRELKDIYFDPFNLARRFFVLESINLPPCTGCGELHWNLSEQPVTDVEALVGCWGWIFKTEE